jgi:tripartite-type tricarboxylate transporter receptor subunit TctC
MRRLSAILAACLCAAPAAADSVRDFYAGPGHQIKFIIRTPPGGGYDLLTRLLARHLGRHIPGEPLFTPINMPAGGGIAAANYMASVAPKDGTVISIMSQGLASDQALGLSPQLTADLRDFNWIANVVYSPQLITVWHTSPTKTIEDAMKRVTTIGTTGAGSASVQFPAFYNNVLGTKFKIIVGYAGGGDIDLAMEKGEVEGRGANPYSDYMAAKPDWIPKKLIVPLMQAATVGEPNLPDTPLLRDYPVKPEDKPLTEFMTRAATVGRPLATTPGVPAERVAALRKAFEETTRDPAFIADAEREHADIRPMSGPELEALIRGLLNTPSDVKARVKTAIEPRESDISK